MDAEDDERQLMEKKPNNDKRIVPTWIAVVLLFFILQLYVSLSSVIFQKYGYDKRDSSDQTGNNTVGRNEQSVILATLAMAGKEKHRNTRRFKNIVKSLNLQLNNFVKQESNRQTRMERRTNFSHVFSFMISSVFLIGNADFKPPSTAASLSYAGFIIIGLFIVVPLILHTSRLILAIYAWMFNIIKRPQWTEQYRIRSFFTTSLLLFSVLLLCGARLLDKNFLTGFVVAMDLLTKTGNYEIRRQGSISRHPFLAMLFGIYIFLGATLFFIMFKLSLNASNMFNCSSECKVKLVVIEGFKRTLDFMTKLVKRKRTYDDDENLAEAGECSPPRSKHLHTFDPPVRWPMHPRVKLYRGEKRPSIPPLLVIKEVSPDFHGEYVNRFPVVEGSIKQRSSIGSKSLFEEIFESDSWQEFLKDDERESSVSEYSFEGSYSSDDTDIDLSILKRRESGYSDTNVVTGYPWLDSQPNILKLTEENLKTLFGNESPKEGHKLEVPVGNKPSLTRKNALGITKRIENRARKQSVSSENSSEEDTSRKISKSDNDVNYAGRPDQAQEPKEQRLFCGYGDLDFEPDEYTRSDFFTNVRRYGNGLSLQNTNDGQRDSGSNSQDKINRGGNALGSLDEADISGSESVCSAESDVESSYDESCKESCHESEGDDFYQDQTLLDVQVIFPGGNGTRHRSFSFDQNRDSVSSSGQPPDAVQLNQQDITFSKLFSTPVRSLSDVSGKSIQGIYKSDNDTSDREVETLSGERPFLTVPSADTPIALLSDNKQATKQPFTKSETSSERMYGKGIQDSTGDFQVTDPLLDSGTNPVNVDVTDVDLTQTKCDEAQVMPENGDPVDCSGTSIGTSNSSRSSSPSIPSSYVNVTLSECESTDIELSVPDFNLNNYELEMTITGSVEGIDENSSDNTIIDVHNILHD